MVASGRRLPDRQVPARHQDRDSRFLASHAAFDVVETIQKLATDRNCTPGQLTLAWCMSRPGITSPIIGPRTMEQLEDNLGAVDVQLTARDHEDIDAISPPGRCIVASYEADFGPHEHLWR